MNFKIRERSNLWLLPRKCLQFSIIVEDGELDGVPGWVQAHSKLRLALGVGDPDELPPVGGRSPVPEGRDEAELFRQSLVEDSQCGHDQVGGGVNPVSGLQPVGASHPRHSGVAVQVDIQLELADKVKGLKVVIPSFVISTGIFDFLYDA